MHVIRFEAEGIETIDKPDWAMLIAQQTGVIWVDMVGPTAEDVRVMRDVFHFHPLAIEDTATSASAPKSRNTAITCF
jgi:Mg2+ and Co2+ transporter CorA